MTTAWGLTKLGQGCVGMQMIGFNRARRNGGCHAHWGFRPVASPVARSTTKRDALRQGFNLSRRTTACLRAACSRLSSCRLIVDEALSLGGSDIGLSLMETHRLTV